MKITKSSVIGLVLGLSLVAACGRDSNNGNGGTPDAGGGGGGGSDAGGGGGSDGGTIGGGVVTIKDIQSDAMPVKTAVELHGVVVIAIDSFGAKIGQDMWVQDPAGGARSGIHVFRPQTADIATLKPGDIVDIKGGVKSEFPTVSPLPNPSLTTVTELQAPSGGKLTITKTGTGAVPAAHLLDAAALEAMTDTNARAKFLEDWEGVYVTLQNVRPDGQPTTYNTQSPAADTQVFDITSRLSVESNLAAFPASLDNSICLASVTGVIDFVAGKYVIYPTKTSEIVSGGTTCPEPTVATPTTIADIQNGKNTGLVKLTDVFVTGVELSRTSGIGARVWLSDSLLAAPRTGILIFQANPALVDATTSPLGTKVNVTGNVTEFTMTPGNTTETEFNKATVTLSAAAGAAPTPIVVTAAQAADLTTGEDYEGVLVTINNLKVVSVDTGTNSVVLVDNDNKTITMDDDAFDNYNGTQKATLPAVGACYASVTGLMDIQTKVSVRTINPRSNADRPDGTNCTGTPPTTP